MHTLAMAAYASLLASLVAMIFFVLTGNGQKFLFNAYRRNEVLSLRTALAAISTGYAVLLFAIASANPVLQFTRFVLALLVASFCFNHPYRPPGNYPRLSVSDICGVGLLWVLFDLHVIGRSSGAKFYQTDWPFISLALALTILIVIQSRDMPGMICRNRLSCRDVLYSAAAFVLLAGTLVPIALISEFAVLRPSLENISALRAIGIVLKSLLMVKFLLLGIGIAVFTALLEELVFRGILQNWLTRVSGNPVVGLVLASICFGLTHLNNATGNSTVHWNWPYAGLATIAGLAYGIVYSRTKNIFYPVCLHGLVDATWHTFFI